MENISSTADLLNEIQILEAEQAGHLYQIREKFHITRENLRPVNIIGSSLKEMVSSPNLFKNVFGVALGLLTGYISRKTMLAGVANSKYRTIFGNVLQFGVASVVARGPKVINSVRQFLADRLYRRRLENKINP